MNFLRALVFCLLATPLAMATDWSTDITLVKDMVVLDKAYIPALLNTRKGNLADSNAAVDELAESWETFQSMWKGTVSQEWRTGFVRIDQLVTETTKLTTTTQDLKRAHILLNEMRHVFAGLRKEADIAYFVDFVTSVEDALDEVVRMVAHDKNTPMAADQIDIAENLLLLAQRRWKVVAETYIDKIVYRIDIYYMGDVASTRAEGVVLFKEITRDLHELDRMTLAAKLDDLTRKVEHFLEILGANPGE